ncbi:unnamed protein product [Dicrocoelium dendriticum]|nr:unnamed protein product [Dicrocoelium dendriticum]
MDIDSMDIDLYAFFGLSDDCSSKEIKRAYREKALQLHPDKNQADPRAKERFQQLTVYYEILHDPVRKKAYDRNWKAKREAAKRHEALDEARRRLKEKLEIQERKARAERDQQRKRTAAVAVADQLRRDWQRQSEQAELEAQLLRKRSLLEQERAFAAASEWSRDGDHGTLVKIKWSLSENPQAASCYTKEFLTTCLSEYGEVLTLVLGKRGTAVGDFRCSVDATRAVEASKRGALGLPTLPLSLSIIQHSTDSTPGAEPTVHEEAPTTSMTSPVRNAHNDDFTVKQNSSTFDSFESDILARMANFTG